MLGEVEGTRIELASPSRSSRVSILCQINSVANAGGWETARGTVSGC
jgi:hypothetical protein